MSNFERVLSEDWLPDEFTSGNEIPVFSKMVDRKSLRSIVEQAEKSILAKLAEQEPVVYRFLPPGTQQYMYITDDVPKIKEFEPLYSHPIPATEQEPFAWYVDSDVTFDQKMAESWKKNLFIVKPLYENPSPSIVRDKTACISENGESETQENVPFTPKTVSEMRSFIGMNFDSLQYANPETEEPDEMDRYTLTIHDLLSAFSWAGHYDCDHIPDTGKMVFDPDAALTLAERTLNIEITEPIADEIVQFARKLHEKYTQADHIPDASKMVKSIRDEFAVAALTGLLSNSGGPIQMSSQSGWSLVNCTLDDVSSFAYEMADAMLAAAPKYTQAEHIPGTGKMIVPEGWQLVPKEATNDMYLSFCHVRNDIEPDEFREAYRAMLATAPKYTGENADE